MYVHVIDAPELIEAMSEGVACAEHVVDEFVILDTKLLSHIHLLQRRLAAVRTTQAFQQCTQVCIIGCVVLMP